MVRHRLVRVPLDDGHFDAAFSRGGDVDVVVPDPVPDDHLERRQRIQELRVHLRQPDEQTDGPLGKRDLPGPVALIAPENLERRPHPSQRLFLSLVRLVPRVNRCDPFHSERLLLVNSS